MIKISIRDNIKQATRGLDRLADRQVPYATALALNDLAGQSAKGEAAQVKTTFPSSTPFTLKSIGFKRARRDDLVAEVYIRDIAARYLGPFIDNGRHYLNSRALLNPKAVNVNQYGNLPKSALARLRARPDVFIGPVQTKHGEVRGVWQRVKVAAPKHAAMVSKLGPRARAAVSKVVPAAPRTKLKLLIRFGDALQVTEILDWGDPTHLVVQNGFNRAFAIAFARALSTAKD